MFSTVKNKYLVLAGKPRALWAWVESFLCVHERTIFWVSGILYKLSLDAMYVWAASPSYAYGGLVYTPNAIKYLISNVLYLIIFAYLPRKEKNTAFFLLHLQFVFTIAPMLTIYGLISRSSVYMLAVVFCALLQIYIVRRPTTATNMVHITGIKNYATVALGILILFAVFVPILRNGFDGLKAFDFVQVYAIRDRATYPPGFEYIQHWVAKTILPFAILIFLDKKKYFCCALCGFFIILMFIASGHKAFVLFLIPIIVIYLCAKTGHLLKLMYAGLMLLFFLTAFSYYLNVAQHQKMEVILTAVVAVRALFGPAHNKFLYYECFNHYPKLFFSDGQVGRMLGLTNPYNAGSGQVIYAFDGGEFMGSNSVTGYLGDSYAQMGLLGLLLMSILFAFVIRGIQAYGSKRNFCILAGLFSVHIIVLNDAALFTTLLSGGMLITYLLVFIYLSNSSKGAADGIQRL